MPKIGYKPLSSPAPVVSEPHTEDMSGPALSNKTIVKELQRRLGARGVVVEVQPAVTTSSFYLTFDYGVLKKARVGDHTGKGYNYSFEIGDHFLTHRDIPGEWNGRKYVRKVYPSTDVGRLVMDIMTLRAGMLQKYGQAGYDKVRERMKEKSR